MLCGASAVLPGPPDGAVTASGRVAAGTSLSACNP